MIELAMVVCLCMFMDYVAVAEHRSRVFWVLATFVLCVVCQGIPLPYLRVVIAGVASFGIMFAHKLITER